MDNKNPKYDDYNNMMTKSVSASQDWRTPPPCSSGQDTMLEHSVGQHAPSPMARSNADHTAWARVARRLGSALRGIPRPDDEPEPTMHACRFPGACSCYVMIAEQQTA